MSDHPTTLTEAEVLAHVIARYVYGEQEWAGWSDEERWAVAEPYLPHGERMAPMTLAARTPTATGDDLRDRVTLPVSDLLMALSYEGSDLPEQDAAPDWKAAHDRVLAAIYGPDASPAPVVSEGDR